MFIALRHLKTKDGPVSPGDLIPCASQWKPAIIASEVNVGNVYDLDRKFILNPNYSPGAHKREAELLRRIELFHGKRVVKRADGTCEIVELTKPAIVESDDDENERIHAEVGAAPPIANVGVELPAQRYVEAANESVKKRSGRRG